MNSLPLLLCQINYLLIAVKLNSLNSSRGVSKKRGKHCYQ